MDIVNNLKDKSDEELINLIEGDTELPQEIFLQIKNELESRGYDVNFSEDTEEDSKEPRYNLGYFLKRRLTDFSIYYKPDSKIIITQTLILINVIVFILMAIDGADLVFPQNDILIKWGADLGTLALFGEPWRLFTSMFVHIGLVHLIFNMYALLIVGVFLEPFIGRFRYLVVYILSGIAGSLVTDIMNPTVVSAGASGAIFGMFGFLIIQLGFNREVFDFKKYKYLLKDIVLLIIYNIVTGLKNPMVGNAAHITGLLYGIISSFIFMPTFRDKIGETARTSIIWSTAVVTLIIMIIAYAYKGNDADFDMFLRDFDKNEEKALSVISDFETAVAKDDISGYIGVLEKDGIDSWEKNLSLISNIINKFPEHRKKLNLYERYCNLRLGMYKLLKTTMLIDGFNMSDSTTMELNRYADSINHVMEEIDDLKE